MTPIVVRLREKRLAAGLTQAELAERAGVRQATISGFENEPQSIDLAVLDRLCRVLGVEPGELLERAPRATPAKKRR